MTIKVELLKDYLVKLVESDIAFQKSIDQAFIEELTQNKTFTAKNSFCLYFLKNNLLSKTLNQSIHDKKHRRENAKRK